ncbi:hypothetical protein SAY87_000249 [Trapa incisa]|uniref:Uncharacterized protein n=1 Tax=Trapa incisa TaxID=236973 RepID=A0AAN7GLZ2_9MYRT|nr:hypothetical protein SAY87_000249 [Trapa incisa]
MVSLMEQGPANMTALVHTRSNREKGNFKWEAEQIPIEEIHRKRLCCSYLRELGIEQTCIVSTFSRRSVLDRSLYQSSRIVSPSCMITRLYPFGSAANGTTGIQLSPPVLAPDEEGPSSAKETSVALQVTDFRPFTAVNAEK